MLNYLQSYKGTYTLMHQFCKWYHVVLTVGSVLYVLCNLDHNTKFLFSINKKFNKTFLFLFKIHIFYWHICWFHDDESSKQNVTRLINFDSLKIRFSHIGIIYFSRREKDTAWTSCSLSCSPAAVLVWRATICDLSLPWLRLDVVSHSARQRAWRQIGRRRSRRCRLLSGSRRRSLCRSRRQNQPRFWLDYWPEMRWGKDASCSLL